MDSNTMDVMRAAFLADLDMVIGNLRDVHGALMRQCQEHGAGWSKEQEMRWEGSFRMVLGVLRDELEPMRDAWAAGSQFSRKGEEIIAAEVAR